ncbi:MAG: TetR/AcrR family transcriptional regulator [Myxococcota bacterium]
MPPKGPKRGHRDPERVRELVLDAGLTEFSRSGYAGTSLRDVSRASGISVGLIQYHFGTKQELYDAVKAYAIRQYGAAQEGPLSQSAGQPDSFRRLVDGGMRQFFKFTRENPDWLRLTLWSNLEGDTTAWPGEFDFVDMLVSRVRDAQEAGEIDPALDPELLPIAVAGLMQGWVEYRDRHASRLAHLGGPDKQMERYLEHCLALLNGVRVGNAQTPTDDEDS